MDTTHGVVTDLVITATMRRVENTVFAGAGMLALRAVQRSVSAGAVGDAVHDAVYFGLVADMRAVGVSRAVRAAISEARALTLAVGGGSERAPFGEVRRSQRPTLHRDRQGPPPAMRASRAGGSVPPPAPVPSSEELDR